MIQILSYQVGFYVFKHIYGFIGMFFIWFIHVYITNPLYKIDIHRMISSRRGSSNEITNNTNENQSYQI